VIGTCVLVAGIAAVLHRPAGTPLEARTLKLAAGAALCFGVFYLALDAGAADSAAWTTAFARVGAGVLLVTLALRSQRLRGIVSGRWLLLAASAGVADAIGNLSYAAASAVGELSVVSLISAAYPAVTVALAVMLLGERITVVRAAGIVATVAGLGLVGG
jgi:drug/metabolite transporter (DMT)-like permease